MAVKKFHLNTEPHVAELGPDLKFFFEPEVDGAVFASAYQQLAEAQAALGVDDLGNKVPDPESLKTLELVIRTFLGEFMLERSKKKLTGTKVPLRVLTEMISWVAEIYGGGPGNGDGGSSSDSSTPSSPTGISGSDPSPSKVSTPADGI